ncbi:AraC family transcriptional regulator [Dyadobacter sp. CY326]|uniref:helix-turn-helix domain-containing protein n=1 Tax=Dyadobacter sp. CY326 TaxID=2907300 RepID=UPI001F480596|nr:helix-turn-helix transcriptional regulator [Dyadobacter sp. CY326]MCE7064051.1 helix-turn-helix transcriptional regulator [Dyadobacter sp. CY326]
MKKNISISTNIHRYFNAESGLKHAVLTVEYLARQLNLSSNYLSDALRSLTRQGAQQHIQEKLIEKAKEYLTAINLSVSEIAYNLGFERPQSFNKLFKNKIEMSPLEFLTFFTKW